MPQEVGFALLFLGILAFVAARVLSAIATRRKIIYGIEGDSLRLQPHVVLIVGLLTTLVLFLGGGLVIALGV
ncbi:hypothetical protein ACFDTO_17425 [Microbacteriaceae bacterium 4G12]